MLGLRLLLLGLRLLLLGLPLVLLRLQPPFAVKHHILEAGYFRLQNSLEADSTKTTRSAPISRSRHRDSPEQIFRFSSQLVVVVVVVAVGVIIVIV